MSEVTQKQVAFYKLYSSWLEDKERYVPLWEFLGEMYIKPINTWVLMSYKCPTRLSDIFNENPTLLERKLITGKSGSVYFGYRLRIGVKPEDILDPKLYEFYKLIKSK